MKKTLLLTSTILALNAVSAQAENPWVMKDRAEQQQQPSFQVVAPNATGEAQVEDPVMTALRPLQREWARIKYQIPDEEAKLEAIHMLEEQAAQITAQNPGRAEPMIWEGIILSTDAGIVKGLSALGKVKKAKALFEQSLQIDSRALDGSAHTSLGSLYYQVPGWPIGFGDDDEAEKHLQLALRMNPNGIDPNFFYGDFLLEDDREDEAKVFLERALQAPNRPDRPLADAGRRQEIKARLAKIAKSGKDGRIKYN